MYSQIPFYERKLLSPDKVLKIKELVQMCQWEDGIKTTRGLTGMIKKNIQAVNSQYTDTITSIIMESLDENDGGFFDFCIPKNSNCFLISKTCEGGYYHPHRDSANNGDFSTTVFISDPSEYDGGELCLYLDGTEKKIKPESGYAITYKTGTLHRVNEVTSGERIVCVFWTSTVIKNPFHRSLYLKLRDAIQLLHENNIHEKTNKNFDEVMKDPIFILKSILQDILGNNVVD